MRFMFDLQVDSTSKSDTKYLQTYLPFVTVLRMRRHAFYFGNGVTKTLNIVSWTLTRPLHTFLIYYVPIAGAKLFVCVETTYPVRKLELVQIRWRRLCLGSQFLCPLGDLLKERWQFERLGDQRPAHGSVVGVSLLRGWGAEVVAASLGAQ
jgi:hypothetical protein